MFDGRYKRGSVWLTILQEYMQEPDAEEIMQSLDPYLWKESYWSMVEVFKAWCNHNGMVHMGGSILNALSALMIDLD